MTAEQAAVYVPEFSTMDATLADALLTAAELRVRAVLRRIPASVGGKASPLRGMLVANVAGHLYLIGPGAAAAGQQTAAGQIQSVSAGDTSLSFGAVQENAKSGSWWSMTAYGRSAWVIMAPFRGPAVVTS